MSRIVQLANFVAPHSGGIRTTLAQLACGYATAGHEVFQIIPGDRHRVEPMPWGLRFTVPAIAIPGTGYRLMRPRTAMSKLHELGPQHIEVHDRSTLRGLGGWARARGVGSLVISHERLDQVLGQWLPRTDDQRPRPGSAVLAAGCARPLNSSLAATFDTVVATTAWAAAEFTGIARNIRLIPLGVDLAVFAPPAHPPPQEGTLRLALASRLSREKCPQIALDCLRELRRRGYDAHLKIAGEGPLRTGLERACGSEPVEFIGHLPTPEAMAELFGWAHVVLAPGPVETFGLAALEAMACGTPVIANESSAVGEVLGSAGQTANGDGGAFADAVVELFGLPQPLRRQAARERAQEFTWQRTVAGFLAAHQLNTLELAQ